MTFYLAVVTVCLMREKEDSTLTSFIVFVLSLLVLCPLGALITGWVISKYWNWFMSADFGPPPSTAALFGVASVVTMLVSLATAKIKRERYSATEDVLVVLFVWVGMLLSLGVAGVAGKIVGWL